MFDDSGEAKTPTCQQETVLFYPYLDDNERNEKRLIKCDLFLHNFFKKKNIINRETKDRIILLCSAFDLIEHLIIVNPSI